MSESQNHVACVDVDEAITATAFSKADADGPKACRALKV